MSISVIVPAYNEERYLGETLKNIQLANEFLQKSGSTKAEVIVVDNDSTDGTSNIALSFGASVVKETKHNVARVRNAGATASKGNVLVFVDADTIVPVELLLRIETVMKNASCFGGAVDTDHRPAKTVIKIYLKLWSILGKLSGMAQGATQFCRRDVFSSLSGYDESLYMGEDVDFFWRLTRWTRRHRGQTCFIEDLKVVPSARRFDQWSLLRTLIWTNPFFVLALRRKDRAWRRWYKVIPR